MALICSSRVSATPRSCFPREFSRSARDGSAAVRWNPPVAKARRLRPTGASVPALLALWHFPGVRGAAPPGGLLGELLASGAIAAFGSVGGQLVAVAALLAALFLTTRFSIIATQEWAKGPIAKLNLVPSMKDRYWSDWHERRERNSLAKAPRRREGFRPPAGSAASARRKRNPREIRRSGSRGREDRSRGNRGRRKAVAPRASSFAFQRKGTQGRARRTPAKLLAKIANGPGGFRLPPATLLNNAERSQKIPEDELKACARAIEEKCKEFDVTGYITQINPGPVVTTYEFKPEAGIKYSRITGLADDLCLALRAESLLIERIPGKSTIGIEVPNQNRQTIALREEIESSEFVNSPSKLTLAMGKDLIGRHRITDLAQMPHLLIAGSTGTGKSVFLNSLIISMLYKATPDELKMVMVDPKRLELGLYENIPHLLAPVVTDPKVASNVLRNATREMERRLKLLAQRGVRNIEQYNRTFQARRIALLV